MDGTHFSPKSTEHGEYRYITAKNIKVWGLALDDVTYLSKADHDEIYRRCPVKKGDVLYIKDGATTGVATINPLDEEFSLLSSVAVLRGKVGVLDNRFLVAYLNSPIGKRHMLGMMSGVAISRLTLTKLNDAEIPLPPLEVQKEIVAEIEGYQKVINGARAVLDHYRPHIPIHPDWPMVELGEVCETILTGPFGTALHQSDYVADGIPVINPQNIVDGAISKDGVKMVSSETRDRLQEFTVRENDIVIGRRGEMGRCAVATSEMKGWLCGTGCFVIRLKAQCEVRFAFFQIASPEIKAYLEEQAVGVTMKNLNQSILSAIQIPLPPRATQQAIVTEIEAEQSLVAANRELIARFEQKIQVTLARVWGEDEPTPAEA